MSLFDSLKKAVGPADRKTDTSTTRKPVSPATAGNPNTDQQNAVIASEESAERVIEQRLLFAGTGADWFQQIERDLRRLQPKWGCQLATDAAQAAAAIEKTQFHAVIMTADTAGDASLAGALRSQTGQIVRIVLCETGDRAALARWTATGASPLPQALDAEGFSANVSRMLRVAEWMTDAGMKKLLAHCKKLPAMPKLYSQVTEELSSPNGSIDMVAQVIGQDPVMTAKMLQVVNSAFFALGRQVTSSTEAVMFLGAERTRSLVLLAGVFTQFDDVKCPHFSAEQIWNHSLQVATLARTVTMAETRNARTAEAAFTAGLVHDMGKLILAANVPTMCSSIEQLHQTKQLSQRDAEMQVLGTTHAELAACLLGNWALPLPLLEAVAWHHCPTRSADTGFTLLTAVMAANVFAYELGCGTGSSALPEKFDHQYLIQIGLGDRRNEWRKACALPARPEEDGEHARIRLRRDTKQN